MAKRKKIKFIPYKDRAGEFRSRIVASNGRIIFDSGEGYKSSAGPTKGINSLISHILSGAYEVIPYKRK